MRRPLALVLALLALGLAACGGDDDEPIRESAEPVESAPELRVPGGDAEALQETAPDEGTGTDAEETAPAPEGSAPAEPEGEAPPDSPENDTPPPPGSPPERFEEFCEENPGAC